MPEPNVGGDAHTFYQWIVGIGGALGAAVAAWYGNRQAKKSPDRDRRFDDELERLKERDAERVREHDEEIERLRVSEAERIRAISDLNDERIRRDFAMINDATRQSMRDEVSRLEKMINRNQTDISVLRVVVGLKPQSEE